MSWKIGMPNLGHTMEEGTVSQWLKTVGDAVRKGEVIAVVESDKASFDIESPADGMLLAIHAQAGAVVPVGDAIGVVGAAGEMDEPAVVQPTAGQVAQSSRSDVPPDQRDGHPVALAARPARGKISPAARALAEELGVDWQGIEGTGEGDMVTRDDVRAHASATSSGTAPTALLAAAMSSAIPLSPMRRAIAGATERAWQTIPHVALQSHADVTVLVAASGKNLTAGITRASALALGEHPAFNGWLADNAFTRARHADIALAVSTPAGLVTAVVTQADEKSTADISIEIGTLAERARAGGLDGAKMTGASFTVSSLGRWGVDAFSPVIAAPQVAILGVGRINRVAREGPGGTVRFASEICLTLVFDHRANDGVAAAEFLASIVGYLEQPKRMEIVQ